MLRKCYPIFVGFIFVCFPFLVHFGLPYLSPFYFGLSLFILLTLRVLMNPSESKLSNYIAIIVTAIYCGAVALFDSEQMLRYYPVLMSLYFSLLFFLSLFDRIPLIEKLVKISGKPYPDAARSYMRTLTKLWVALLFLNALVASFSACCSSDKFWLLYNGLISYLIILGFIFGEIIFRYFYRRKYESGME